jgi:hypothetical protein
LRGAEGEERRGEERRGEVRKRMDVPLQSPHNRAQQVN